MQPDYSQYPEEYHSVLREAYEQLVALQRDNKELYDALEAADRTGGNIPLSVPQIQQLYTLGILTIENWVKEPYHVALYWMRQQAQ